MRWRRRQRRAVAAWLGLFALVLQALVPLLVAGELAAAARAGDHSAFELCLYGHLHEAVPPHTTGTADRHGRGAADLCPICIALHAAPAFTTPTVAALPMPALQEIAAAPPLQQDSAGLVAAAAYRSRAPPIG